MLRSAYKGRIVNKKNLVKAQYPTILFATRPISHLDSLPLPNLPQHYELEVEVDISVEEGEPGKP